MSDRPTPEVDALAASRIGMWQHNLPADFSRGLERQRDEARELARELRDALVVVRKQCHWDGHTVIDNAVAKAKEVLP